MAYSAQSGSRHFLQHRSTEHSRDLYLHRQSRLIGQAVKPDRRRIRHLFYAPKRLQEFPVKAALRSDNEMIARWQLHVTILCPVERDYVIEDSLHYILKGARTHDAHRHLRQHLTSLGPFNKGRVLDLSTTAAKALGMTERGVILVRAEGCEKCWALPGGAGRFPSHSSARFRVALGAC